MPRRWLFDPRGKQIGSDAAVCTRLFDATSLCTGIYKLPGGQVMVQLLQPGPAGTYDQAITGGTRRFAGGRVQAPPLRGRRRLARGPD